MFFFPGLLIVGCLVAGSGPSGAAQGVKEGTSRSNPMRNVSNLELEKALSFYRGLSELAVDFKMTKQFKDIPTKLSSEGSFQLNQPDRLTWRIKKPSALVVAVTKSEITITSGTGSTATTQTYRRDDVGQMGKGDARKFQSLASWLSLDAEKIGEEYLVRKSSDGEYEFTPKDISGTAFSRLKMKLRTGGDLERLTIFERSGDSMELTLARPTVKRQ